ncbi:Cysteine synthase 2 [Sphaceloma murrayae]|uniref:Cysteine synthase 2 n=1 Tax=Sphaceloma murrayae TaxID=2082308 RepID=A0A2K1QR86_9PEZI|nr:Cysteine synthase 2 [Sphaceloma murrayae]
MVTSNPQTNFFAGPDSLRQYYNPDIGPPLPLVEVPGSLNPYRQDGVRIYAKMMTMLPAHNVKSLPALNLLSQVSRDKTDTIVEYSSGSTVVSMSILGRVLHNLEDTRAYLSNKTSGAKLRLMQFFGLDLTLFGGPSQPEPCDARGGIQVAHEKAATEPRCCNPNQYKNDANWQSHLKWTGPQLLRQLPEISVVCAGMGTSGTMTGLGTFFKEAKPSVCRVGVCTAHGDRVPGPRSLALLEPVEFPWRAAVDVIEHVGSKESYKLSMDLSRQGLICGPSSGFNLQGLYQFLERHKQNGTMDSIRSEDGSIHCAFLCCDLPYQYIDEYFAKLGSEAFPAIHNQELTAVDLYRYEDAWEISPAVALDRFMKRFSPSVILPRGMVIDLRQKDDFDISHFPFAQNLALESISRNTPSPFENAETLSRQWRELDEMFEDKSDSAGSQAFMSLLSMQSGRLDRLKDKPVLAICYDGNTSRVATSVLRAKGIEAWNVVGGWTAFEEYAKDYREKQTLSKGESIAMERRDSGYDEQAEKEVERKDSGRSSPLRETLTADAGGIPVMGL